MILKATATPACFLLAFLCNAQAIELCQGGDRAARKVTCLVDGDTGWENGVKWRPKGWDTPDYSPHAECEEEIKLADTATNRLRELMTEGYTLIWHNGKGYYQRELVSIRLRDGRMVGDVLMAEGLAVRWPHPPRVWCPN